MSAENWLEQLKPGDKVILGGQVVTVERVTAQSVRVSNTIFNKQNGRERGGDKWHIKYIYQWSAEKEERINAANRRKKLVAFLNIRSWEYYSLETLEAIRAIVEQAHRNKEAEQKRDKAGK